MFWESYKGKNTCKKAADSIKLRTMVIFPPKPFCVFLKRILNKGHHPLLRPQESPLLTLLQNSVSLLHFPEDYLAQPQKTGEGRVVAATAQGWQVEDLSSMHRWADDPELNLSLLICVMWDDSCPHYCTASHEAGAQMRQELGKNWK